MLNQSIERLSSIVSNADTDTQLKSKQDSALFPASVVDQIRAIAESLGVDYDSVPYTFKFYVKDDEYRMAGPQIYLNSNLEVMTEWGGKTFRFKTPTYFEVSKPDNGDFFKLLVYVDDNYDEHLVVSCRCNDSKKPARKGIEKAVNDGNIGKYLDVVVQTVKITDLPPGTYKIGEVATKKSKAGNEYSLAYVQSDAFTGWFFYYDTMPFGEGDSFEVTEEGIYFAGDKVSFGGKGLKDLDEGSYLVESYKIEDTKYGPRATLELKGEGKVYGNAAVTRTLLTSEPIINAESPAELVIKSKTTMKDGKIRVNCSIKSKQLEDELSALLS